MFVLMISRSSSALGQKLGHQAKRSRCRIFEVVIMNIAQNVFLIISSWSLKLGQLGSKTRSLGQIKVKPYLHSRVHIFEAIIMNLAQNVCLDDF